MTPSRHRGWDRVVRLARVTPSYLFSAWPNFTFTNIKILLWPSGQFFFYSHAKQLKLQDVKGNLGIKVIQKYIHINIFPSLAKNSFSTIFYLSSKYHLKAFLNLPEMSIPNAVCICLFYMRSAWSFQCSEYTCDYFRMILFVPQFVGVKKKPQTESNVIAHLWSRAAIHTCSYWHS